MTADVRRHTCDRCTRRGWADHSEHLDAVPDGWDNTLLGELLCGECIGSDKLVYLGLPDGDDDEAA